MFAVPTLRCLWYGEFKAHFGGLSQRKAFDSQQTIRLHLANHQPPALLALLGEEGRQHRTNVRLVTLYAHIHAYGFTTMKAKGQNLLARHWGGFPCSKGCCRKWEPAKLSKGESRTHPSDYGKTHLENLSAIPKQ